MTNHEAIQFLNNMIDEEHGRSIGAEGFYRELCAYHVDALRTAIKALSQQTEYHGTEDMDGLYYCPICQQTTTVVKDGDKCPKCGATMDELSTRAQQTEDAISRQAAIEKIHWLGLDNDTTIKCDLAIRALSPVKPQPKTGYWKYAKPLQAEICSCCGCIKGNYFFSDIEVPIKFCSNCGAKMESEEQEREGAEC